MPERRSCTLEGVSLDQTPTDEPLEPVIDPPSTTYLPTPRTTPTRLRERASYDREAVHAVLDEAYICHVGYALDGAPAVLPNIHARVDDVLYLHGSTGMRLAKAARTAPVPVCVTVTLLDGLVLARSWFHHSMNYRCAVVRGEATLVTDPDERDRAFEAIVNHVVPGRAAQSRPPDAKERAATAILRVPLVEVSLKHRSGGVNDDEEDYALPHWAGVVPLATVPGEPRPDGELPPSAASPTIDPRRGARSAAARSATRSPARSDAPREAPTL